MISLRRCYLPRHDADAGIKYNNNGIDADYDIITRLRQLMLVDAAAMPPCHC